MNDLPFSLATLVGIAVFSTITVFGLVWRISHQRIESENRLKFSASPVSDVEKGKGQLLKTTEVNPASDTLASIDQIAQDIFNRPKTSGGGKKKALSISKTGVLQISVDSNSSSIERRHYPVGAEESKLDQIKVRVRSATVNGEAPKLSKIARALNTRRTEASDDNNASSAQSEMSNDGSSNPTSEKSLIFNTRPLTASSASPECKNSTTFGVEESN